MIREVNEKDYKQIEILLKQLSPQPISVIENLVVEKTIRSEGIGKKLIMYATKIAEKWNCYKLILETGSKQDWKLSFYKKCGLTCGDKTAFIKRFK